MQPVTPRSFRCAVGIQGGKAAAAKLFPSMAATASIQTEAASRSLAKSMHNKELWRMNEVNASMH
jgi:hypothetical protein